MASESRPRVGIARYGGRFDESFSYAGHSGRMIELLRTGPDEFVEASQDNRAIALKVWGSRVRDFTPLERMAQLIHLEILDFEHGSLRTIGRLKNLRFLRIIHIPKEHDLTPLAALENLEELLLESLPSWDASGKTLVFESLRPLAGLKQLKRLVLMKVRVEEHGLQPLWGLTKLERFETENLFTLEEFAQLAGKLPNAQGAFLLPHHEVNYAVCSICQGKKVRLSGVRRGGLLCPRCNGKRVAEHARKFEGLKGRGADLQSLPAAD